MNRLENNMPDDTDQVIDILDFSIEDPLAGSDSHPLEIPLNLSEIGSGPESGLSNHETKVVGSFEVEKPQPASANRSHHETNPDELAQQAVDFMQNLAAGLEDDEHRTPREINAPVSFNPDKPIPVDPDFQPRSDETVQQIKERAIEAGDDIGKKIEPGVDEDEMEGVLDMARNSDTPAQRRAREQKINNILTPEELDRFRDTFGPAAYSMLLRGQNIEDLIEDGDLVQFSTSLGGSALEQLEKLDRLKKINRRTTPTAPPNAPGGARAGRSRGAPGSASNSEIDDALARIRAIPGYENLTSANLSELEPEEIDDIEGQLGPVVANVIQRIIQGDAGVEFEDLIQPGTGAPKPEGVINYRRQVGGLASRRYPTDPEKLMAWVRVRLYGIESLVGENATPTPRTLEFKKQLDTLLARLGDTEVESDLLKKINAEVESAQILHNVYRSFIGQKDGNGIYNQVIQLRNKDMDTLYQIPGVWEVVKSLDLNADKLFGAKDEDAVEKFYTEVTKDAARKKIIQAMGDEAAGKLTDKELASYVESAHLKGLRLWEMKRASARDHLVRSNGGKRLTEADITDDKLKYADGEAKWIDGSIRWNGRTRFNAFNALRRLYQVKEAASERLEVWKELSVDVLEGMRGGISHDFYTEYADLLKTKFNDYVQDKDNPTGLTDLEFTNLPIELAAKVIGAELVTDGDGKKSFRKQTRDENGKLVDSKNDIIDIQKMKMIREDWSQTEIDEFKAKLGTLEESKKDELFESLFKFGNIRNNESVMDLWATTNIAQADPRREALFSSKGGNALANNPGEPGSMHAIAEAAWTPLQRESIAVATASFKHRKNRLIKGDRDWGFEDILGYMNRVAGNNDPNKFPPINKDKVNELALRGYIGAVNKETYDEKYDKATGWEKFVTIVNAYPTSKSFIEIFWIIVSRFGFDLGRRFIKHSISEGTKTH